MSNAAGIPIARVTYSRKAKDVDVNAVVEDLATLEHSVRSTFPDFPLDVELVKRNDKLYLTVTGYYRYIRMFTVRLLYRGWKIYRNIQILEEVAVRPTVSRAQDPTEWVSVASPAYNTRAPLAAPAWHNPAHKEQTNTASVMKKVWQKSMNHYGLVLPYGQAAAHRVALEHNLNVTPSPERTPYETPAQYAYRKRRTQAMRNIEKRRAAILSVYEAAVEEKMKAAEAAAASEKKQTTGRRRTTRKQTGA